MLPQKTFPRHCEEKVGLIVRRNSHEMSEWSRIWVGGNEGRQHCEEKVGLIVGIEGQEYG